MRGGRQFSRRPRSGDGDYGGKFRPSNSSSFRDSSSGGRFNDQSNGRRFNGGTGSFVKNTSSGRNRSRYDRRSPSDRFPPRNNSRDDSATRKRPRHEGNRPRRPEYGSSLSHDRHRSNGDNGRGGSNQRSVRRSSPPAKTHESKRTAFNNKESRDKRPQAIRPARKFLAKGPVRDKNDGGRRAGRKSMIVRSNVMRRREAVQRAKILRSSLKIRDAVKQEMADDVNDDGSQTTDKLENSGEKSAEKEPESVQKKAHTKGPSDDEMAVDLENDGTAAEIDQDMKNEDDAATGEIEPSEEKFKDESGSVQADDIDIDKDSKSKRLEEKDKRKKFVRLLCPHCRVECATFRDYNKHLHSRGHKSILGRYGLRQKTRLARMRLSQRNAQRQLEEESIDTGNQMPQFCLMCRLNYRSPKEQHQASEAHRKMKHFLMPFCETCETSFKSPMTYEIHRCSLEHLRRKAKKLNDKESEIEDNEDAELQVDLDSFLTVDSVGDVDGSEFSLNEESDEMPIEKTSKSADKSLGEINVGSEHVKKVEVMYCDLCRYYLPHLEDTDAALQKHCSTRNHLRAYLRYKENLSLKITAEMIHRREHKDKSVNSDGTDFKSEESTARTEVWDDTDKDLEHIEPDSKCLPTNTEDDDSVDYRRYDRFKNSEKIDEEAVNENNDVKGVDGSKLDAIDQNGEKAEL